jgi:hypothetical protein
MRSTVTASALALALTLPLAAQAKTTTHEQSRIAGYSANASWSYDDGTTGTFVNVQVTENDETGTAGPGQDAFVALAISRYDIATGNVLIDGVAYAFTGSEFQFTADRQLNTATLHAKNMIFQDDNSFTFFNVDIDLTWAATAEATTMKQQYREKVPGMLFMSKFNGSFRDATASGSIFGKDTQFTPAPSTSGQLQFNKFGSVSVTTTTP